MDAEKRYQVFVSSTYLDLMEARAAVVSALLNLDAIPAGMELFPAADDDAWTLIEDVIADSDYYLLIIGGSTARLIQSWRSVIPSGSTTPLFASRSP